MRWVLGALLLLNASFFVWQVAHTQSEPVVLGSHEGARPQETPLRLLSEVDVTELRRRTPSVSRPSEAHNAAKGPDGQEQRAAMPSRLCYRLGPLSKDEEIAEVRTWLQKRGATATLRVDERRERMLYWVYLPPFTTRARAEDMARQMMRDGINDIYVIPGGNMAHAISLGAYSQRASLERRLAQLESRRYTPSVSLQSRTQKASWFDAEFPQSLGFPEDDFAARFPSIEVVRSGCK
jgi:hypothetical protein